MAVSMTSVENLVIQLLAELQSLVTEDPVKVTRVTVPLKDLAFFDSLLGLEMTVALERELGISIEEQTVFSDEDTREPLSITQIAQRICEAHAEVGA